MDKTRRLQSLNKRELKWKSKPDSRWRIQRKEHWWLGSRPTKQWRWWHRASWELLFRRVRRKTEDEDVGGEEEGGRRGQEWYGYHGKMCRFKSHGTGQVILPGWIWTSTETHADEIRDKEKYIFNQKCIVHQHAVVNETRQYTVIQSNQTRVSDNCIQDGWGMCMERANDQYKNLLSSLINLA